MIPSHAQPGGAGEELAVERLEVGRAPEVVRVLCEAFRDYPVMRHVLGPDDAAYDGRLATLVRMFVMARVLRGEPLLGVADGPGLVAAALVSDPHGPPPPAEFAALREAVWAELGAEARRRYDAFGDAWARMIVDEPHVHLNMIGVRPEHRGRGLARRLLEAVHRLARETPGSRGVTLSTETPANLALYEHFGYRVIGHATVGPGVETWGLFRPG